MIEYHYQDYILHARQDMEANVPCKWCASELQSRFGTEIAIHLKDINKPHVLIFPDIYICLNCGKPEFAAEFSVPDRELHLLVRRDAAGA